MSDTDTASVFTVRYRMCSLGIECVLLVCSWYRMCSLSLLEIRMSDMDTNIDCCEYYYTLNITAHWMLLNIITVNFTTLNITENYCCEYGYTEYYYTFYYTRYYIYTYDAGDTVCVIAVRQNHGQPMQRPVNPCVCVYVCMCVYVCVCVCMCVYDIYMYKSCI